MEDQEVPKPPFDPDKFIEDFKIVSPGHRLKKEDPYTVAPEYEASQVETLLTRIMLKKEELEEAGKEYMIRALKRIVELHPDKKEWAREKLEGLKSLEEYQGVYKEE